MLTFIIYYIWERGSRKYNLWFADSHAVPLNYGVDPHAVPLKNNMDLQGVLAGTVRAGLQKKCGPAGADPKKILWTHTSRSAEKSADSLKQIRRKKCKPAHANLLKKCKFT